MAGGWPAEPGRSVLNQIKHLGVIMFLSSRRVSRLGAVLLACSALSAVPASAQQAPAVAASESKEARFGTWGVDLATRDLSVKPGDDFQR